MEKLEQVGELECSLSCSLPRICASTSPCNEYFCYTDHKEIYLWTKSIQTKGEIHQFPQQ